MKKDHFLACPVVLCLFVLATPASAQTVQFDDGWTLTITPGPTYGIEDESDEAAEATADEGGEADNQKVPDIGLYDEIYKTVPFRRAVFNANPQYRHDATMAVLFGKQPQTVIHRHTRRAATSIAIPHYYRVARPIIYYQRPVWNWRYRPRTIYNYGYSR